MDETSEESASNRLAMAVSTTGAAGLGAMAGLMVAGPPGAILGAVGIQAAIELTSELWRSLGDRRRLNAAVPVAYAAGHLGKTLDEVTETLATDRDLGPIASTVLIGAVSTELNDKLFALGRVLTNVLEDQARVDEEHLVAMALNVIEAPHIRMLDDLERTIAATRQLVGSFGQVDLGIARIPLTKTLESAGLVFNQPILTMKDGPRPKYPRPNQQVEKVPTSSPRWGITELGQLVMTRLREASEEVRASMPADSSQHQPRSVD